MRAFSAGYGRAVRNAVLSAAFGTIVFAAPQMASAQNDLSREVEILKRDLKDLQRYIYRGEKPPAPSTQDSSTTVPSSGEAMPNDVAGRLQIKMQRLERQMRELTGRVEETEFQVRKVSQRLETLASDLEFRLQQLEGGGAPQRVGDAAGSGSGVTSPENAASEDEGASQGTTVISSTGTTTESDSAEATSSRVLGTLKTNSDGEVVGAEINPDAGDDSDTSSRSALESQTAAATEPADPAKAPEAGAVSSETPTQTASATAIPDGSPKEQYDYAFSLLRKRDYGAAETAMRSFIDENGENPLAGNAMYWLGETYYARENYRDAAATFLDAYTGYPENDKASHSLLKLGMSLGALGKKEAACQAFATLEREGKAGARILSTAEKEAEKLGCS